MSASPCPAGWNLERRDGSALPALQRRWAPYPLWLPADGPLTPALTRHYTTAAEAARQTATAPPGLAPATPASPQTVTGETVTPAGVSPRLCQGCGQPLNGKRPQARAHGPACRQKAYRRRQKLARSAGITSPPTAPAPQAAG